MNQVLTDNRKYKAMTADEADKLFAEIAELELAAAAIGVALTLLVLKLCSCVRPKELVASARTHGTQLEHTGAAPPTAFPDHSIPQQDGDGGDREPAPPSGRAHAPDPDPELGLETVEPVVATCAKASVPAVGPPAPPCQWHRSAVLEISSGVRASPCIPPPSSQAPERPPWTAAHASEERPPGVRRVPYSDLVVQHQICHGSHKAVYSARWRAEVGEAGDREVAMLALGDPASARRELSAYLVLRRHPHLALLLACTTDPDGRPCIVTELARLGSLDNVLGGLAERAEAASPPVLWAASMQVRSGPWGVLAEHRLIPWPQRCTARERGG